MYPYALLFQEAGVAYLIQYLGLGAVFFVGLFVAVNQGDVGLHGRRQRTWFLILLGGYLMYAVAHGILQFVTVSI